MQRAFALLLALLAIPGLAWAQAGGIAPGVVASRPQTPARDGSAPQTGTGRVRGRVMADTGQPLRRAPMQLTGNTLRPPRLTTTDAEGRYEFADLPSGHFTISVSRTGYIRTQSDPFDLADAEHRDNVDLKVVRGGVITGQVVDEFGEPAISANVSVMRSQYSQGVRRLVNAGPTATSNDIGEFRLFGLSSGQYYISVAPRNDTITIATPTPGGATPPLVTTSDLGTGYAPTYYPGTPDAASAQRVNVSAGQTTGNVNIVLVPTRLSKVSGTAIDGDGRPIARGNVNIVPRNGMGNLGGFPGNAILRPDGSFTVANVPPGEYYLRVPIQPATPPPPPTPGSPPPPPVFAIASVSVFGDDISGVTLLPMKPVSVRGRIMFDDALAQQSLRAENVRVIPQPIDTSSPIITGGFQPVPIKDDFSFDVPVSPAGPVNLRVTMTAVSTGTQWRVKAVRVRGEDVSDTGLSVKPGENIDDVEIEMTTRSQTIAGTVVDGQGAPVRNALVLFFSQDRDRWSSPTARYTSSTRTDDKGQFKAASALPAGDYYAFVVPDPGPLGIDPNDPEFLETASRSAIRMSLMEGSTTTLNLSFSR